MSIRAIRRSRARRQSQPARRSTRVALGSAGVLTLTAALAPAAQAANTYVVNTNADDSGSPSAAGCQATPTEGTCTLRDAITAAGGDTGADTIQFNTSLSGQTITLSSALSFANNAGVTIDGGTENVTVSGNDAVQVLTTNSAGTVAIDHLTIAHGSTSNPGGAVAATNVSGTLRLVDDTVEDSKTTGTAGGGGVYADAHLDLSGTTITGNTAAAGEGGGVLTRTVPATIAEGSTISHNTAANGGGIAGEKTNGYYKGYSFAPLTVDDSTITYNTASGAGGGIDADGDGLELSNSTVSQNQAQGGVGGGVNLAVLQAASITGSTVSQNTASGAGGGIEVDPVAYGYYRPISLATTTVSANHAASGAGVGVATLPEGTPLTVGLSTVSGNSATGNGGGVEVSHAIASPLRLADDTIAANSAVVGGGLDLGDATTALIGTDSTAGTTGSIELDNSTVSGNMASAHGGGIYLGAYTNGSAQDSANVTLESTIVAGDQANSAGNDLERSSTSTTGGFAAPFSLIQAPGTAPLVQQQTITGKDPLLGKLAVQGGSTATMAPAGTSPVIDQGHSTSGFTTDQTGAARTIDTPVPNSAGGDGTDIGAVELPAGAVQYTQPPPATSTTTTTTTVVVPPISGFGAALVSGTKAKPPLLVGTQTPVACSVRTGLLHGCTFEVRSGTSLLAAGEVTNTHGAAKLSSTLAPTAAGASYMVHHTFGGSATLTVAGDGATVTLPVHFLAQPSIVITTGTRSTKISHGASGQLSSVAKLLTGAKSATCTAYTDQEPGRAGLGRKAAAADVKLTKSQAKAACSTLVHDGLKVATHYSGGGHGSPIASNRTARGRTANRRLVISFKF